ncbi:hypothetical protein FW343_003946 [Escherichia coli]|nr:hypothetical protein [Escherichia coli]
MDDKQITFWLNDNGCSADIPAIAEALTNHAEWLLELAPDPIEEGSSCLPPAAAAGIFLGAAAMVHCGETSGAETWLEAAITDYHFFNPNGHSSWRGSTPVFTAISRYPALRMVLFNAACAMEDWNKASTVLESLFHASYVTEDDPAAPNFTPYALKAFIADNHPLGPAHYDEIWLLAKQAWFINAGVLDERTCNTWMQYTRHLRHLIDNEQFADALAFVRSKKEPLNHIHTYSDFYLYAIGLFSSTGKLSEALTWVKQLIRNNDSHFYDLFVSTGKERRIKPELTTLLNNLLHSAEFQALQDKYLTGEYGVVHSGPFMSVYEKVLGGKSRKRCAISRKLISPGEVVYKYRHVDTVEYIAAKAAFQASELNNIAHRHENNSYQWQDFAARWPRRGSLSHPDIARYLFERQEGKCFDAAEFIQLIGEPFVFPMRFIWVAGLSFELHQYPDAYFVNDNMAGEFVNLCWMAMKCGHAGDIFQQLAQEPHDVADPIYAMLATFDRADCRSAAAAHFGQPEIAEIMALAFSSRLSLDSVLTIAEFGKNQPRFSHALATALLRYNLHIYSNYMPQVNWFLQGLEHYALAKGGQLLNFFVHIPEHIPVLATMLEHGVLVRGIGEGAYDGYHNSANSFHHAAVMHCLAHAPEKVRYWMEPPWIEHYLLKAPLRQTARYVEAWHKKFGIK